jgi:hypothetical protein
LCSAPGELTGLDVFDFHEREISSLPLTTFHAALFAVEIATHRS